MVEAWAELEADWRAIYHSRLSVEFPTLTWREFTVYVRGLLSDTSTRLNRAVTEGKKG